MTIGWNAISSRRNALRPSIVVWFRSVCVLIVLLLCSARHAQCVRDPLCPRLLNQKPSLGRVVLGVPARVTWSCLRFCRRCDSTVWGQLRRTQPALRDVSAVPPLFCGELLHSTFDVPCKSCGDHGKRSHSGHTPACWLLRQARFSCSGSCFGACSLPCAR